MTTKDRDIVDAETRKYLDEFKKDVEKLLQNSEDHIKEIFDNKISPMSEHISENKKDIKSNIEKINNQQIDLLKLSSEIAILKDNKDTKQKQEAIDPKKQNNIIAIISIIIGFVIALSGILIGKM